MNKCSEMPKVVCLSCHGKEAGKPVKEHEILDYYKGVKCDPALDRVCNKVCK